MHVEIHFSDMSHTLQIVGCHFGVKPAGWEYPRHHHHLFEIIYCWDGAVTLIVDDHEIRINSGDLLLLKPGVKHHSRNDSAGPHTFFNIHFNIDDLELRNLLTASPYQHMKRENVHQTRLPAYMDEIESLLQQGLLNSGNHYWMDDERFITLRSMEKLSLQGHILLIMKEVISYVTSVVLADDEDGHAGGSTLQIDVAHEIEARLQSVDCFKGVIAQIAQEQNISRSHCHKIFTRVYGMSPRQYLSQLKLNQAKLLLLGYEFTIEEISKKLGFSTISHFSRQFRRWTGVSPNQFRPKP